MKVSQQKRKLKSEDNEKQPGASSQSLQNQEVDDIPEDYEEDEAEEGDEDDEPQRRGRGRPRKIPVVQAATRKSVSPLLGFTTPVNKKRKRELLATSASAGQNKIQAESFVMKLFDRTLDLSKYTLQTALYPICRAWMANAPRNPNIRSYREVRSPSPPVRNDNGVELMLQLRKGMVRDVSSLPKPKRTDIPKIAPQPEPTKFKVADEVVKADDPLKDAEKEVLIKQHVAKWKRVKSNWQKHAKRHNKKNEINFSILQALFKP